MPGDSCDAGAVGEDAPPGAGTRDALARALPAYVIGEELGRGAHGLVVAARHRRLDREVAVKQLLAGGPEVGARFVAEGRLLASLDHPHIVPIYDFVEVDGLCALVMERLTGGTIQARQGEKGFSAQAACAVVLATCAALEYAHSKGVLHRDIKPQNLLLSADGVVKVADFGIAKLLEGAPIATRTGLLLGTPAYMAPEQIRGDAPSPSIDLYAAATVLYELLCGSRPFPPLDDAMAVLYQHANETPVPLLERAPEVPRALAHVTDTALRPDPGERYASARELAAALAAAALTEWGPDWMRGTGIVLRTATPASTAERRRRSKPGPAARPGDRVVEFRILGPLHVIDGERSVSLGGAKQRAVLALLLLRAGEVVSAERLIDEMWGERPPPTAAATLQVYVSRLRKELPAGSVVTEGRGYRLVVAAEQIDARRFQHGVETGRSARAGGDAERAARVLREALELWRGPALADFAYEPFAQGEIARLEELRAVAVEERVDADLACGRHAELVGELEALIATHPLRERLRGQLMLALYRSGRQAEALQAYQDARRALVDELGIEPTPALREVERAILAHDTALAAAPIVAAPPPQLVPVDAPPAAAPEPTLDAAGALAEPAAPATERPARKVVTVLFSDVAASGMLAAELDPERLERLMGRFFDTATEVVVGHGGVIDKFIGDAVMAVFGVPRVHEDDAARALRAALDLRDALAVLNDELDRDWGVRIAVRTGVNTGEVMTGDARSGRLVTGDAVVVATRLQQAAEPSEVLVGERTAAAARGAFEFGEPREVQAKGRDGVRGRRLLRALSWDRPRGVPAAARVFVGRRSELDLLAITHERVVRGGEPHLVAILGDPGVGKTTLVAALRDRLGQGVAWHVGRCLAYGRAVTYRPLAEILRGWLGVDENESGPLVLEHLGDRRILGLALGLDPGGGLHPQEARRQLQEAWVEFLGELAADGPAVVVIEDLHWAQDPLLELLERTVRRATGPLLLLVTARPELVERTPAWTAGAANASQLRLEPLSSEEAAAMLEQLAGPLPGGLGDLILDRAEGNPFFLEEAVASLIDRGVLADDGAVHGPAAELPVPDSVQGVIAARVDLLPSAEKEALLAAAVVGRTFWEGAVSELVDGAPFEPSLLEERGFVRRRPKSTLGGEPELVFKHALIREVAYGSLPLARRARLHARVAEWLERSGASADEHAPLLAHHYAEAAAPAVSDLAWTGEADRVAELRDHAVTWLRRAADLALDRYEIGQSVELLADAVELARDDPARIELLLAAARACRLRYDTDGFRAALERALNLDPPAAVSAEIHVELAKAGSAPELWREPPPLGLVNQWADRGLALAEPGSRVEVEALVAQMRARPQAGRAAADRAIAAAERIGDPELTAYALMSRSRVANATGALDDARACADRALAVAEGVESPFEREGVLMWAVLVYARAGLLTRAAELAAEHDALAARLSPHQEVHAVATRVMVESLAGEWDAVVRLSPRAEAATAGNLDTPCQFNWRSLIMAAHAHGRLGDEREARRLEDQALSTVEVSGPASREPALLRLALLRRDLPAVERLLTENPGPTVWGDVDYAPARLDALAMLGDQDGVEREAPPLLVLGGYGKPFALRALAAVRGDSALREQAAAAFDALGLAFHAAETRNVVI